MPRTRMRGRGECHAVKPTPPPGCPPLGSWTRGPVAPRPAANTRCSPSEPLCCGVSPCDIGLAFALQSQRGPV